MVMVSRSESPPFLIGAVVMRPGHSTLADPLAAVRQVENAFFMLSSTYAARTLWSTAQCSTTEGSTATCRTVMSAAVRRQRRSRVEKAIAAINPIRCRIRSARLDSS